MLAADGPVAQVVSRMAKQMLAVQRIQPEAPLPKPSLSFLADP
jgi:hypothetical protein